MVKLGQATEINPYVEEALAASQIKELMRAFFKDQTAQLNPIDEETLNKMSPVNQDIYRYLSRAKSDPKNYFLGNSLQVLIDASLAGSNPSDKLATLQKFIIIPKKS